MGVLETGVEVSYRTAQCISARQARLWYDAQAKAFVVSFLQAAPEPREAVKLYVKQIASHKAKTYKGSKGEQPALIVGHADATHVFTFATQKDRDDWNGHIGNVLRMGPHWTIRNIKIVDPGEAQDDQATGQVMLLRLDLARVGEQFRTAVPLSVREGTRAQTCKAEIVRFVQDQDILEVEGASLYRLVKTLLQRRQVKQETQALVEEIGALHVDVFRKGQPADLSPKQVSQEANDRLSSLVGQLPSRLGEEGAGAQLVAAILGRNIEKLRAVNETGGFPRV